MPLDSLWREREFTQPQCELCRDPNFDVVHFQNGFLKRLPHNERKSSALSKLLKSDRFWAVFSVHDDLHPFLELWNEPTEVAAGKPPQYVFPLAVCQHIRSGNHNFFTGSFLPSQPHTKTLSAQYFPPKSATLRIPWYTVTVIKLCSVYRSVTRKIPSSCDLCGSISPRVSRSHSLHSHLGFGRSGAASSISPGVPWSSGVVS